MKEILRNHIEEVVTLTDEEFDYVFSFFTYKKFKKNQFVIQEGDYVKNDYFILSGLLKSSSTDDKGKENVLLFATTNWWISDPEAFHNQTHATLNIDCIEKSETLFISYEQREQLCLEMRKMEFFFRKKTTAGYVALQKRITSLISENAKSRYHYFLHLYPELLQKLPKILIASYLGVSRETLSRLTR